MDATKIVVLVMTVIAVVLLVLVELRSRKNQAAEKKAKLEGAVSEAAIVSREKRQA